MEQAHGSENDSSKLVDQEAETSTKDDGVAFVGFKKLTYAGK